MISKLFSSTRYLIVLAVISCIIAAAALIILAGVETVQLVIKAFSINLDPKAIKLYAITFIEVIDILLLGTVFYITGVGLYELFIDENLPTPKWLQINHLDDLKSKLIGVTAVILVVAFLSHVVNWNGDRNIFYLGSGIALVITAITLFLGWRVKKE